MKHFYKRMLIILAVLLGMTFNLVAGTDGNADGAPSNTLSRNIITSDYLFWDFSVNYPPAEIWPAGWTYGFNYFASEGYNSGCARSNLYTAVYLNSTYFQSAPINMGSNPEFSLYMKLTYYNTPDDPIPADLALTYFMAISDDNGATWDKVKEIGPGDHVHNADYVLLSADVSAYANKDCIVRFDVKTTPQTPQANLWFRIDDITIGTPPTSSVANDLAATAISGDDSPQEGVVSQYKITVKNIGTALQSNYTVKLMQANQGGADTELGSTTISQSLASEETADINVAWTPSATGSVTLYGQVVLAGDEDGANDKTENLAVNVQTSAAPGDYIVIDFEGNVLWPNNNWTHGRLGSPAAGEGVDNSRCVRVNLYTMNGMETTFFQSPAIDMGPNPVFSFYMRITNRGTYPNEHALTPETPITYSMSISDDNGATWNKLMEVLPGEHAANDGYVFFNPDVSAYASKSCRVRFDASTPMPATPYGTVNAYIRLDNIAVGTPPSTDFAATAISGDDSPKEGVESQYKITVQNKGVNPQDAYTVKLMRTQNGGDVELGSTTVSGQALDPEETAEINVAWTPTALGNATLYGQVIVAGDVNAINDKTSNLTVNVQRANDLAATAIDGNVTPSVGIPANYTVTIQNAGHSMQDTYTVKLMQAVSGSNPDIELASQSVSGQEIAAGQSSEIRLAWTPTNYGTFNLYGTVALTGDSNTNNDNTSNLSINVQPEDSFIISVGGGNATSQLPYNFQYSKSLSQSLYFPHEIGMIGGEISKITYSARIASTGELNANIQNVPIQVWIGETDKENLSDGYVDPSTLILVFDGRKSFPTGNYDVTIDFIEPYQYKGGNLVIYSFQNNSLYAGYNDLFVSTNYPNSSRSRYYRSDNMPNVENPDSYGAHHIQHGIPNTRFLTTPDMMDTMGSLSGIISDEDGPLAGARVQIVGTQYYATTDANGTYIFPLMAANEYDIQVTMYGYGTVDETAAIIANTNTELNVELSSRLLFTVSGNVKRYGTNAPIENAAVSLNCEDTYIYSTESNADGTFSIAEDVFAGLYELTVTATGLDIFKGQLDVDHHISNYEVILHEISYPATNVQATIAGNEAVVAWNEPSITGGGLQGYAVYCLLEGAPEAEWTELNNSVATLTYTDQAWASLPWGVYQYAVKAKYPDNQYSPAVLSGSLAKDMLVSYTVNVATNIGNTPLGATVILTNQDADPEHVYTKKITKEDVIFDAVWKGTYNLEISLKDIIRPYFANSLDITSEGLSHTAEVFEIPYSVIDATASIKESNAVIAWDLPKTYNEWIHYLPTDEIAGGMAPVGYVGEEMTTAIRFTPADLERFGVINGQFVTKVALGIARNIDEVEKMEIRIWEGGTSVENPGELVYTHEITNIIGNEEFANYTWVDIILDEPYAIDPSKELRIGWTVPNIDGRVIHGIGPKEDEEGPVWNNGKMTLWTSTAVMGYWRDASLMLGGQFRNCIKAFVSKDPSNAMTVVELGRSEIASHSAPSSNGERNSDFSIATSEVVEQTDAMRERIAYAPQVYRAESNLEYEVYRLKEGDPETDWTLLSGNVTELAYTDTDWSGLPDGEYQYAIKANYAGELSDAALTNILVKEDVPYDINLQANPAEGGAVSGGGVYNSYTEITVTATANPNYDFVNWTEDGEDVSVNDSYTFTVTGDRDLVANFELATYAITATAGTGGAITPNGEVVLNHGTSQTFVITANDGYAIKSVLIDGVNDPSAVNEGTYTFTNIITGHTISATFEVSTGIGELDSVNLKVYPNPTDGRVTVNFSNERKQGSVIQVYDIFGRLVQEINQTGNNEVNIDLSNHSNVIYFLKVDGQTVKVIKQ